MLLQTVSQISHTQYIDRLWAKGCKLTNLKKSFSLHMCTIYVIKGNSIHVSTSVSSHESCMYLCMLPIKVAYDLFLILMISNNYNHSYVNVQVSKGVLLLKIQTSAPWLIRKYDIGVSGSQLLCSQRVIWPIGHAAIRPGFITPCYVIELFLCVHKFV